MAVNIESNLGVISIQKDVIAKIAGSAALECYGIVGMAATSVRDGLIHLLKKESLAKGIEIDVDEENNLKVTLHIIVEYGTNIPAIGDIITSTVKYRVEESLDLSVNEVIVCVDGIRNDYI